MKDYKGKVKDINNIQILRNLAGALTEHLVETYKKVEGAAVVMFPDKCAISSLWGDFMNHTPCRLELYTLLVMQTNI